MFYMKTHKGGQITCGSPDGRCYRTYHNHAKNAALLGSINLQNISLMRYLRSKQYDDPTQQQYVNLILSRYNPDVIRQNIPTDMTLTAFVLNKGDEIAYCMDDYNDDRDTLWFVNMHEISHLADDSDDNHGPNFWRAFKFITHEAQKAGLYTPKDFSKKITPYCGLKIDYSPYFDQSILV